jgi:hypothetical protein
MRWSGEVPVEWGAHTLLEIKILRPSPSQPKAPSINYDSDRTTMKIYQAVTFRGIIGKGGSNAPFQYSLLKYHHFRREEWLTLGVLVLFPEQRQLRFLAPEKLRRLRQAFPDAPEKVLANWLKGFEWQAEALSKKPEIFAQYDLEKDAQDFVAAYFLPPDGSALQFAPAKTSVLYSEDINLICNNLRQLYLDVYYQGEDEYGQKDNAWLAAQYRKYLREKNADVLTAKRVREGYVAQHRERQYKFEFAWQNHTFHLVNTVSFDLKLPESIQRKSEQYFGKYALLQDFAEEKTARFDLLVARPSNRRLYGVYDKAVEDIARAGNVTLIGDNDLSRYAERTIQELA